MSAAPLPLELDELRVSPDLGGFRRIYGDPVTGSLVFEDPVSGRVLLSALGGWQPSPGWTLVGPGEDSADLAAALQNLAAEPAPALGPSSVVMLPGLSDLPARVAPGQRVLASAVAAHVVSARLGAGAPSVRVEGNAGAPASFVLRGALLGNSDPAQSALQVVGDGLESARATLAGCSTLDGLVPDVAPLVAVQSGYLSVSGCNLSGKVVLGASNSEVHVSGSDLVGDVRVTGKSQLDLAYSRVGGLLTVSGTATIVGSRLGSLRAASGAQVVVDGSVVGGLILEAGAQVTTYRSRVGDVAGDPTSTFNPDGQAGTEAFNSESFAVVSFSPPRAAADYVVVLTPLDRPLGDQVPWVSDRSEAGFMIQFPSAQTLGVSWTLTQTDKGG